MKVPEGLSEIITVPDGTCLKVLKNLQAGASSKIMVENVS
jgi:hypothetical protein